MRISSIALATVLFISGLARAESIILLDEDFNGLAESLRPAVDESIPSSILGWTHTPPEGWTIDNSKMGSVPGMTEWQGWTFATMRFWTSADTQDRSNYTLSNGVFAIADPDEWDDRNSPGASGTFNSVLISPPIQVSTNQELYLYFDSHYRQEDTQRAQVRVSFNGEPDIVLLDYHGGANSDNKGVDAENVAIVLPIPKVTTKSTM
ncbi:MAG: hypothetical protein ABIH23_31960, partial [bacterium]